MIRHRYLLIAVLLCCLGQASVLARQQENQIGAQATDKIYTVKEVDQHAVITSKPEPRFTEKARKKNTHGNVILRLVLNASGQVTNIVAVKKLKNGLTEEAIKAAQFIAFQSALKDGHPVSQYVTIVYNFNIF